MPLDAADLAYMRETQVDHHPTVVTFQQRGPVKTATGGSVDGDLGEPVEGVLVRIDASPDRIPVAVATRMESAPAVKISGPHDIDARPGDLITVSATEAYVVVSIGEPDEWTTAQVIWCRRLVFPAR